MGCTQSKIENEEAVSRCKDRRQFMKDSVAARNAFAAAHSAYAMSLKNTGAALSDYASGEVPQSSISSSPVPGSTSVAAAIPSTASATVDSLPPPPPLPSFAETPPLQRAVTMPEIKIQKPPDGKAAVTEPIIEEEDEEEEDEEIHVNEKLVRRRSSRGGNDSNGRGDHEAELPPMQQPQRQPPRRRDEETMRSQPAQMMQQDYMEYWFPPMDSIPGPSLADPIPEEELVGARRNDLERNTFHSAGKIVEEEEDMEKKHNAVVEEVEKKPIEVTVPAVDKNLVKKVGGGGGRRVGKVLNLMQVFLELDDHFLKASESAHEVSKMLEATRLHYHSNFADNRGHIDHSARVMRVITWNRSFRGIPNVDDVKDDFDSEEHETHATVLDKMLAWEKKLYDEVKANEIMKVVYQKKVATLNKLKKRNPNSESLEKLKAAVSHLHTRYIVDMQSMDSTVSEINRLRDEQLYPKLVQLVDGMATMWETMRVEHETQSSIVNALRYFDISQSPKETSEHHHERTFQLWVIVQEWHSQFCKLIDNQKAYIKSLNNWLKLNLIPIESSLREKVSSPPRIRSPPIRALLIAWHDHLEKLPDEVARGAINNFAAVINTIFQNQEEEMKLKVKCEHTQKELMRKTRQFEDWYHKYMQQRTPEELDFENEDNNPHKEAIAERQYAVDQLKQQLQNEEEEYQKQCLQVREKSLASLKTRLPELFRAMSDISFGCSEMYKNLRSISHRPIRN